MKKFCVAIGFVLLGLCPSLWGGQMQWESPVALSSDGRDASEPQIAIDSSGNAVAIWEESGAIKARVKRGASWDLANTLTSSGASSPRLAMDFNGNAIAVWLENGVVKSSSLSSTGGWGSVSALSSSGASSPQLAMDSDGNAVAIWTRSGLVESATKLTGGIWPLVADILSLTTASSPQVAMGNGGTVIAVWLGAEEAVYAAQKSIGEVWGVPEILSDLSYKAAHPKVAVDAQGNAVAIWFRLSETVKSSSKVILQEAEYSLSGGWLSPTDLSLEDSCDPTDLFAEIAFDAKGNVIALWNISEDGSLFRIQTAQRKGGGKGTGWSLEEIQVDFYSYEADLSVSPSGTACVAYMSSQGADPSLSLIVQATTTNLNSPIQNFWSFPAILSTGTRSGFPRVAINSNSENLHAAAVWISFEGRNKLIQTSMGSSSIIAPPQNLAVVQNSRNRDIFTEYYNVFSWDPSPSSGVVEYLIYRDGFLIARVSPTNPNSFEDRNRKQNEAVTYGISARDFVFNESEIVTVDFPQPSSSATLFGWLNLRWPGS